MNPNNRHRFEALDAFRGLAAVLIILFHSQFFYDSNPNTFVHNSYIFVDFFFVLSGFVMSYSYKERILNGIGFKKFTLLRFARLYPLHLFTLFIWLPYIGVKIYLYSHGMGATDPMEDNNIMTFVQNIFLLQGISSSTSWNYPSWSIGVEFYTYMLFFAVILFSYRFSTTGRYILIGSIAFIAYLIVNRYSAEVFVLDNMFRCVSEFFLGVLIYVLHKHTHIVIRNEILASILEVIVLLLMVYSVMNMAENNGYKHYTILLFMAIVYLFSIENIGYVSKILRTRPFQHLGKISYSIYMIHALIVTGMYNVLMLVFNLKTGSVEGVPTGVIFPYSYYLDSLFVIVVIGLSTLTYKYIEIPGQAYLKSKFEKN